MKPRTSILFLTTIALLLALSRGADAQVAHTSYARINTQATTVLKGGAGTLTAVCINTATSTATITIYDNNAASGTIIALITEAAGTIPNCLNYNVSVLNGITVVTGVVNPDITIGFQ